MHKSNIELLKPYLEGKLEGEDAGRVRAWLADHADDEDVEQILLSRFDAIYKETVPCAGDTHPRWWFYAAAVAAILMLGAGIAIGRRNAPADRTAWCEITVPAASEREITLSDGSTLRLKAGSRITYPETFAGDERQVFFEGEMQADIASDAEHPFIIKSGEVSVSVRGTSFDFKAYDNTRMVELMLFNGNVDMQVAVGGEVRGVSLTPGDVVHFDRPSGEITVSKSSAPELAAASTEGVVRFLNVPLGDIAADLSRSFGTNVTVVGDKLAAKRFFGIFSNGESLEEILEALDPLHTTIEVSRKGDGFILSWQE